MQADVRSGLISVPRSKPSIRWLCWKSMRRINESFPPAEAQQLLDLFAASNAYLEHVSGQHRSLPTIPDGRGLADGTDPAATDLPEATRRLSPTS